MFEEVSFNKGFRSPKRDNAADLLKEGVTEMGSNTAKGSKPHDGQMSKRHCELVGRGRSGGTTGCADE